MGWAPRGLACCAPEPHHNVGISTRGRGTPAADAPRPGRPLGEHLSMPSFTSCQPLRASVRVWGGAGEVRGVVCGAWPGRGLACIQHTRSTFPVGGQMHEPPSPCHGRSPCPHRNLQHTPRPCVPQTMGAGYTRQRRWAWCTRSRVLGGCTGSASATLPGRTFIVASTWDHFQVCVGPHNGHARQPFTHRPPPLRGGPNRRVRWGHGPTPSGRSPACVRS